MLKKVLTYDRFHVTELHWGDRVLIHQHNQQGLKLPPLTKSKIQRIIQFKKFQNWIAPDFKYNESRELEYYNEVLGKWQVLKQKNEKEY